MERDRKDDFFFFFKGTRRRFVFIMFGVTVGGLRCVVLVGVFSSSNPLSSSNRSFLLRVSSGVIVVVGGENDLRILFCFLNGEGLRVGENDLRILFCFLDGDGFLEVAANVFTAIDFVFFGDVISRFEDLTIESIVL